MSLHNARYFIGTALMLGCAWAHGMDGPAPGGGGKPAAAPGAAKKEGAVPKKLTPQEVEERLNRPVDYKGPYPPLGEFLALLEKDTGLPVRFKEEATLKQQCRFAAGNIQQVPVRIVLDYLCCMTSQKWKKEDGYIEIMPAAAGEAPQWPNHPGLKGLGTVGAKTPGAGAALAAPDPKLEQALAAKLDAVFNGTSLPKVLETLSSKAGVRILFQAPDRPWGSLPLTTSFKDKTLKQALDWITETSQKAPGTKGLKWAVVANQIVVGAVLDEQGGKAGGKKNSNPAGAGPAVGPGGP